MSPRETTAQRGYGAKWQRFRRGYLRRHPLCLLCGDAAAVPDHWPESRRELVARGVKNPDQDPYLRPLCVSCHNKETAKHQPGGWAARPKRRRDAERHPGLV